MVQGGTGPEVSTTAIKVELENIEELEQYFRYMILVIREAVEFKGEGSYSVSKTGSLYQDKPSFTGVNYYNKLKLGSVCYRWKRKLPGAAGAGMDC